MIPTLGKERQEEDLHVRTSTGWRISVATVFLMALWLGLGTLVAHHSFSMFDTAKTVTLSGTVTAFEWTNPHAYIEIDVSEAGWWH